ncbi:hypothetical protein NED98_13085 [Sphingomonas sp. MMSM20]|uniref:hypothetical protein n=1 Tax=Sphingomonas lycopersici TaxID=2951807 RepID=UPI002238CA8E|nr:hypothetical protein [Sphingomonas lycopersici]MCW6531180.1 hypothetical protein [Sphingomonas lycopersici]
MSIDRYPDIAGHRGVDTSIAAAEDVAPAAGPLQRIVLAAIAAAGPLGRSTNEIADQLELDRGSIQPRTSELRLKRLIADSGLRRRNANGKRAIVWVLPQHAPSSASVDPA